MLLSEHRELLERSAIPRDFAAELGVRSVTSVNDLPEPLRVHGASGPVTPGLLFPWRGADGSINYQLRPDEPLIGEDGKPRKYLQGRGVHLLNVLGDRDGQIVWIVEGTKQALSAAAHVGQGVLVVGIPGCWNAMANGQLLPELAGLVEDKAVVAFFDADVKTNPHVWAAARALEEALVLEGARPVRFVSMPGEGTTGLDDLLGRRLPEKRQRFVRRLAERAGALPKKAPAGRADVAQAEGRPSIDVTQDRYALINTTREQMINSWDGWRLFNHGGVISELADSGMTRALDRGQMLGVLAETARFVRPTPNGPAATWPDANVIAAVASHAGRFTRLDRVSRVPFVRRDGTVCQVTGYDAQSRTFLLPGDILGDVTVPESPSADEIRDAVDLLGDEWFGDMPLTEEADRANLLALVLTPFVRGLVPLVPLAVVDGLQMGVGKNLLADCVALLVTGSNANPLPYPSDDDEQRKVITSTFATGAEMFVFDEAHSIGGKSLARALTATTYTDRILGVSQMANYPNSVTWVALGNQVQVHGDLARRVYRISLRPTGPDPDRRDAAQFRHPDLREWTLGNRGRLVTAALTLVRAWFAAGQPTAPSGVSFGSFEAWDRMIGGILHVAGVPGFLANTRAWRAEADYESGYWRDHLHDVWCVLGEEMFTISEVVDAMKSGLIEQMPPNLDDCTGRGFPRELGQTYGRVKDRWYGNLRIRRHGTPGSGGAQGKVNKWRIEERQDPTPAEDSRPAVPDGPSGHALAHESGEHARPFPRGTSAEGSKGSEGSEGSGSSLSVDADEGVAPVRTRPSGEASPPTDVGAHQAHPSHPSSAVSLESTAHVRTRSLRVDGVMQAMSTQGIRVDLPLVRQRLDGWDRDRRDLVEQVIRDWGFPAQTSGGNSASRPWSSKAGQRHLRDLVNGTAWPLRSGGQPAVDRASLHAVMAGTEPGRLQKLAGIIDQLQRPRTFLQDIAMHARAQRVHPIYASDTATGRWTSRSPNVFGAGRRTEALLSDRDVVLAEPGHVLVGVDLAGIDARCVAGLSGDNAYAELVTGTDPHGTMAQAFFGSTEHRSAAKAITHGLNYGRGPKSIAEQTGKTVSEIEGLLRHYREAYPGVLAWQTQVRTAASSGRLETGTGRFVAVDPASAHTQAPARVAQAAACDLASVGLLRIEEAGLLPNLRLFLHDEVVLSVPRAEAEAMAAEVAALMSFLWRAPSGLDIPIKAEPHPLAGTRWSDIYVPRASQPDRSGRPAA